MFSKLLIVMLYMFSKLIFMIPPQLKIIPASATGNRTGLNLRNVAGT